MLNRILAITILSSFASVAISQEGEVRKDVHAPKLLSNIKNYRSTAADCETFSFRLEESIGDHISIRIDACHLGNRSIALMISESKSECPIAIFVDDQFLVVDIVAGKIFRGSGLTTSAAISQDETHLRTHWHVSPTPGKQQLILELRSLLPDNDVEGTWLDFPDSTWIRWKARKLTTTFCFSKGVATSLSEVTKTSEGKNLLSLSQIKSGTDATYYAMPDIQDTDLTVEQLKGTATVSWLMGQKITVSAAAIGALSNKADRKAAIFPEDLDWAVIQRQKDLIASRISAKLVLKKVTE